MNATTINAFPPLHAFNSSRSWALATIVLLHLGFFWVLSNGLSIGGITLVEPPDITIIPVPEPPTLPPQRKVDVEPDLPRVYVPDVPKPDLDYAPTDNEPRVVTFDPVPSREVISGGSSGSAEPVVTEPTVDPRLGLTQPVYPASEIRTGHEGTVVLAIEVLENGRIGAVRIEQSSGYARLDESAAREARRWRMVPGTRDGVPTRMWKRVPITFRLQDAR